MTSTSERIVGLPREGCYADDGSPIKCPECGHAEFTEPLRDFMLDEAIRIAEKHAAMAKDGA